MHDIDRAMYEMNQEQYEEEQGGPTQGQGEWENWEVHESQEQEGQTQEMELAAELLEVRSDAELDRFLGNLLKGAISAGKSFVNSNAGRAVGGLLKSAAKQYLPAAAGALGNLVAPGIGGQAGSAAGSWLANRLELEGLSQEDREFESARAFVRFANDTVKQAASAPSGAPPAQVAVQSAMSAAQKQLPTLVPVLQRLTPPGAASAGGAPSTGGSTGGSAGGRRRSGRWVRRGSTITLFNV